MKKHQIRQIERQQEKLRPAVTALLIVMVVTCVGVVAIYRPKEAGKDTLPAAQVQQAGLSLPEISTDATRVASNEGTRPSGSESGAEDIPDGYKRVSLTVSDGEFSLKPKTNKNAVTQ